MNVLTEDWDQDDDAIDLRAVATVIWAKRWWVALSILIFTGVFTRAAFVITPVYRASTILVPASSERRSTSGSLSSALGQLGGLASLAGLNVGTGDSETEEALAVLRSRQFTERFIEENGLMPKLFSSKWDAAHGQWKMGEKNVPTPAKAYQYFNKKIRSITQDKKTGLVTLRVDWKDRNDAAAWANDLVRRLNSEMRTRAIQKADASVGYLEKELKATSVLTTQEAINHLIEGQINQRMLANVTQEYTFRVADKAMPSDPDDPVSPNKPLLIALGPVVGIAFGIVMILTYNAFKRKTI